MRTIPPESPEGPPSLEEAARQELVIRWILPFRLFGNPWFMGFLLGRELTGGARRDPRGIGGRIAAAIILALLLIVMLAGLFFILYLIKTLVGVDLFSNAHLME